MKKMLIFVPVIGLLLTGAWLGTGGLWKIENNTLKPAVSNWKVEVGSSGMNSDTVKITSGDTFLLYMKNDTARVAPLHGSGFLDLRQTTILFPDGDMYFGSVLPSDSVSRIGASDSAFRYGYFKQTRIVNADKDTFWTGYNSADTVIKYKARNGIIDYVDTLGQWIFRTTYDPDVKIILASAGNYLMQIYNGSPIRFFYIDVNNSLLYSLRIKAGSYVSSPAFTGGYFTGDSIQIGGGSYVSKIDTSATGDTLFFVVGTDTFIAVHK